MRPLFCRDVGSGERFEATFRAPLGGGIHVIALGRARAGIYLLVKYAVSSKRNRVVLSPYTIPDVINMVKFAGGAPVFVDHLPNSTNIDVEHLSSLLDDSVCCVMITHYHVNQNQMRDIRCLCKNRGVLLFDDCALAMGADYDGVKIGTYTDGSIFSMSGFKPLNFLWGGAITTGSLPIARHVSAEVEKWPRLSMHQYFSQMLKTMRYDFSTRSSIFSNLTFPILRKSALSGEDRELLPLVRVESSSLDSSIVSRPSFGAMQEWERKLCSVESHIIHRRSISSIYDQILGDGLVSGETSSQVRKGSCFVNYPILVDAERRTRIYKHILSRGFDVGLSLYPNVHEMPGFTQIPGQSRSVSALVRSIITLPTHPIISEEYATSLAGAAKHAMLD